MTQDELLRLPAPVGNVTLIHLADLHAQLKPVWFRESSVNIGVGEARGQLPHLTGQAFLDRFKIERGSPLAYAFTAEDFAALAKTYGRMGGLDRIATVLKAIRAGAAGPHAVPRRRRHLAGQLHVARQQGPGHGRLHGAAEARRHDRPLGVHATAPSASRRSPKSSAFRFSARTSATPNGTRPRSSRRRRSSAAASRSR